MAERGTWPETRKPWNPVLAGFAGVLGFVLAALVVGLGYLALALSVLPGVLMIVLAAAAGLAAVAALLLGLAHASSFLVLGGPGRVHGDARWLSTRAVWTGTVTLLVLVWLGALACTRLGVGAADGPSAHFALIPAGLSGAVAGWITARLAPATPLRHALAVAFVWALLGGLVTLVELAVEGEVTGSGFVARLLCWAVWLACLLLGAWVERRRAPRIAREGSATAPSMED